MRFEEFSVGYYNVEVDNQEGTGIYRHRLDSDRCGKFWIENGVVVDHEAYGDSVFPESVANAIAEETLA